MLNDTSSKLSWKSQDNPKEINQLLRTLAEEYPLCDGGRGLKLKFKKVVSDRTVSNVIRSRGEVLIEYSTISGAARGIGSALGKLDGESSAPFSSLGIMLDVSRNMVMKPNHFKKWLRRLALAGFNQVYIYAEDTYELEDEPFFGALRGAYTAEELKDLDDYAVTLGIELVGCIQTLGHLEQILHYPAYAKLADSERVMLPGDAEVGKLVDKMIAFWSNTLRSRRIHVGMDEAHGLGRGRYQTLHGPASGFDLMTMHLKMVSGICAKHGLTPVMWSDMFFRLTNDKGLYYDTESPFPDGLKEQIDKSCQLVYWDYYHKDKDLYVKMIRRHRELGKEPVMGSGIWTWIRLWYDHRTTMETAMPCIEACREENVRELFFTMWGDDGAYCEYDSALAGILRCGDLAYGEDDENRTARRFEAVCKADYAAQIAASEIGYSDQVVDSQKYPWVGPGCGHAILWDDPLQGIVFDTAKRMDPEFDLKMLDVYDNVLCRIMPHVEEDEAGSISFAVALTKFLMRKLELRGALEAAYDCGDRLALRELATTTIPAALAALYEFDAEMRHCWLKRSKAFGLERLQVRNAGQAARLEELALRIREFLDGEIDSIEELDARLPWSAGEQNVSQYRFISGASCIV